jgi:hypothetical protein
MRDNSNLAICVVADFRYLYKNFSRIYEQLRTNGKYSGDILVITSILCPSFLIKAISQKNRITVFRFKKLKFNTNTEKILKNLKSEPNRHNTKRFQWQKLHLFNKKLKRWQYIFYIDINMNIHHDINKILEIKPQNELFARADAYPNYDWKLSSQFDQSNRLYDKLRSKYDLEINNYFQTGLMYFDTEIISNTTMKKIISLLNEFPISITNEQGLLNLYFIFIKNQYKHLVEEVDGKLSYYYWNSKDKNVIITKSLVEKYK